MTIGINKEMASEYSERVSLRSRSARVVALCFTRTIPAGMINASRTILRVQKPAAAKIDAETIARSTSLIFFIVLKTLTST